MKDAIIVILLISTMLAVVLGFSYAIHLDEMELRRQIYLGDCKCACDGGVE